MPGAELGGAVVRMLDAEKRGAPCAHRGGGFGRHDALGVSAVLVGCIEVNAADCVLDVQLVLEAVGDQLWIADDQQVVRYLLRVGWAGSGAMAGEKALLRLVRPVRRGLEGLLLGAKEL